MLDEEAAEKLKQAIEAIHKEGYIITGQLCLVKPKVPGLVINSFEWFAYPATRIECKTIKASTKSETATSEYVEKRNTGEVCFKCGSVNLRWAGACKVCSDCGESGGCG